MLGFKLPFYKSATLLLSLGLSIRVLYYLFKQRPQVIHVSTPGIMCFAAGAALWQDDQEAGILVLAVCSLVSSQLSSWCFWQDMPAVVVLLQAYTSPAEGSVPAACCVVLQCCMRACCQCRW